MTREEIGQWAMEQTGVGPDYPWEDENFVLRCPANGKWYALVMRVSGKRLGLSDPAAVDILTIKCDPAINGVLLERPGFHRAYHMNKEKWITIRLDGSVEGEEIRSLLAFSYALTAPPAGKKPRRGGKRRAGGEAGDPGAGARKEDTV